MDIDYYLVSAARRAHRLKVERRYTVGREQGVELHLQDALISRKHAELRYEAGQGWILKDLGSRNGSLVNNERVEGERALKDLDRLQFGGHVFQLHLLPPGGDIGTVSQQGPRIEDEVTMGPGVSAVEIFTQGAAFTGKIGEGGVPDLLQFLLLTRKTGRFDLLGKAGLLGSVHVRSGEVLHAAWQGQVGMDALIGLCSAAGHGETFAFHTGTGDTVERSIKLSGDAVLMELARQLDEG